MENYRHHYYYCFPLASLSLVNANTTSQHGFPLLVSGCPSALIWDPPAALSVPSALVAVPVAGRGAGGSLLQTLAQPPVQDHAALLARGDPSPILAARSVSAICGPWGTGDG